MNKAGINNNNIDQKLQLLENHLEELESQLIRSQRLAAMGTMATMIAHEFNNILTPIVSYAQYALNRDDNDLHKKALEKAYTNGNEAARMCQHILSFARGENDGAISNVSEVVDATLKCMVRNPSKDNIKLNLELDENLWAEIQPALLQQVLYNLMLNARDSMLGKGGRLTISAQKKNEEISIQVTDTGPGIPHEIIDSIFEPFFTTREKKDETNGGSGLGLLITKQLITKANGKITVESNPNVATTFTITLPSAVSD